MFKIISLELAKKLKDAGLEWEPKPGDWYYNTKYGQPTLITQTRLIRWKKQAKQSEKKVWQRVILIPRLNQLFAEIEKLGYRWDIGNLSGGYCTGLFDKKTREYIKGQFYADNPCDSAGQALLWILEQERK